MSGLPYIIGNIAMSLDGKISPYDRSRLNISCKEDFSLRDQIRSWVDGVLVGGQTLLSDNPSLALKDEELIKKRGARGLSLQPAGLAVCGSRSPAADSRFFSVTDSRRIIYAGCEFKEGNLKCEVYKSNQQRPDMTEAMKKFHSLGVHTILAEGGGTLLFNLLNEGLMKEFYLSVHPIIIGGAASPTAFDGSGFSADNTYKVTIIDRHILSDDGMTYHCTVDNAKPMTEYSNYQFSFREDLLK